jgi:acetyltransferase
VTETHVAAASTMRWLLRAPSAIPWVLKLFSHTVTHKTDVDGVQLDLADDNAVRAAYAAILRA